MALYSLEQDLFDRKQQALAYFQQGHAADPMTVSRLLSISRTWPGIKPGAALSFAQAGLDHTSPVVKQAAFLSASQQLNENTWGQNLPGDKHPKSGSNQPQGQHEPQAVNAFVKKLQSTQSLGDFKQVESDPLFAKLPKKIQTAVAKQAVEGQLSGGVIDDALGSLGYSLSRATRGDIVGAIAGPSHQQAVPGDQPLKIGNVNVTAGAQAVTREAATAANMPLQFVQGVIRNEAGGGTLLFNANGQPTTGQTDLGQQITRLQQGQDASLGSGYLPSPDSPVAQAQAQAARQAAPTIGGHAFTLGRFGASQLFEPNTLPFNTLSGIVDAGVAFKADPTAAALATLGDARAANKLFTPEDGTLVNRLVDDTGMLVGSTNPDLIQGTKTAWINSPAFEKRATPLINTSSPSEVIRLMGGDQNATRIVPDLAVQVADATDLGGVRQAFHEATLPEKPQIGGLSYNIRQGFDSKYLSAMPTPKLDTSNPAQVWDQLDKTMISSGAGRTTRNAVLDGYLRDPNPVNALKAAEKAITVQLVSHGLDEEVASKAATMWRDHDMLGRSYDIDQATGLERNRPGVVLNDQGYVFPAPTMDSERLNSTITLPDARELRRLSSVWRPVLENPAVKNTTGFLDGIVNVWKTSVVARPALLAKVTLEQQLNLATRGMPNIFTHPLTFFGALVGTHMDDKWAQMFARLPGVEQRYVFGPDGAPILEDADNLLQHTLRYTGQDPGTFVTGGYIPIPPTHPDAGVALTESLGRMYSDPIMRGVAQAESPEAAKEWFWSGEGKALRLNRAKLTAADDAYNMQKAAGDPRLSQQLVGDIANDRAAADRYIDEAHFAKLNDYTQGSDELMDAVRTGKLNGRDLYSWRYGGDNLQVVDKKAANYAKELLDQGFGPQKSIPLRQELSTFASGRSAYRKFMDSAFHYMIDAPDRLFSRSPAYAHFTWNTTADLAPYINPDELPRLQRFAHEANLPDDLLKRIDNVKLDTTDTPRLSLDQITQAAKAKALGYDLPKTVHDLTSRTHIMDALRLMVPFGDAWRLVMQRAVNLVKDEPQVLERASQGLQAVAQPGSSTVNQLFGDPVNPGDGFFHNDPMTGEKVFTIPGSTLLTRETLGVPIPLAGQVNGLSMMSEPLPSLGGVFLTIPAKWFLPDTPTGDAVRDEIFKYGGSESQGIGQDIAGGFLPSWLVKVAQGAPDQRTFNSITNQVMQTLASSGKYDLHKPDELVRLAQDAKSDARWLYVIRGAAQFVTPFAPQGQTEVYDKEGKLREAEVLANKYREKQKTLGPSGATQWIIDAFGTKNIFLTQPASQPTSFAAPVSKEASDWVRSNPGVESKYPLVYGLFAPQGGKFDSNVYAAQFSKGERATLSPEQQIAQAENRLGYLLYDKAKAQVGGRTDKAATDWLRGIRSDIKTEFPGFDTYLAAPYDTTKRRADAITQLQAAVKDPAVKNTEAGQGLALYLRARTKAIQSAKAGGLASPFQAKSASHIRAWLREIAGDITAQYPDFTTMYQNVFAREMVDG